MGWLSTRGRPPLLPTDRTPLRGARVDAAARIAWLLRVNRLAGRYSVTADFLGELGERGFKLSSAILSRGETGAEPVSLRLISAYESLLELPEGHLLGVSEGVHGLFGPALAPEPESMWSRGALADLWADAETRIEAETITGIEWLTLARVLSSSAGLLPPSVLHDWFGVLVSQTMRSVGRAYTTRMRALSLLVSGRYTRTAVFDEIRDATAQPGVQQVVDVLSALGDSTDPATLRWLIHLLRDADGPHQVGAATALLTSLVTGGLPADLVPELTRAILLAARNRPEQGLPPFWLAQRLSSQLTRDVVAALGRYPASTEPGARIDSPAHLTRYLRAAVRLSGIDDPMLDRLLREGLSPDFIERRHHALLLLRFSPYRDVLADTALDLLTAPDAGPAAGHLLTYLAGPAQRDRLLTASTDGEGDRPGEMLVALANAGGVPDRVPLADRAADPDQAADAVYAAGMSGHRDLEHIAASSRFGDSAVQTDARWWLREGPAVTDDPGAHGTARTDGADRAPSVDLRRTMPGVAWTLPRSASSSRTALEDC